MKIEIYFILLVFVVCALAAPHTYNDYKTHPCKRDCSKATESMQCDYDFVVEWYSTFSKSCYNCPLNQTDCFKPHCIAANGVERIVMSVNRMLPGPSIEVCQNDLINVYVHNNLRMSESTSIHWHGITQKGTPYYDGVGMITQCPIQSHTTFQYKFVAQDAGTHFWHSHSAVQRGDGVFGALIVRQPYEHVIVFTDWLDDTIISKFVSHHHGARNDKPNSILINGKGIRKGYLNARNQTLNTPRAVFSVKKGFSYRFRVINAGVLFCPMQVSVDGHKMKIISVDGKPVEPELVDAIVVQSAERVDFVIDAYNAEGNYWIKAKGLADCEINQVYELAILNYNSVAIREPFAKIQSYTGLQVYGRQLEGEGIGITTLKIDDLRGVACNETQCFYDRINMIPQKTFYFGLEFKKVNNPEFNNEMFYSMRQVGIDQQFYSPQINEISLEMPTAPPLYQWSDLPKDRVCSYRNRSVACPLNSTTDYCSCIYIIEVNLNDLVEFVLVDETRVQFEAEIEQLHPMHLHGYSFAVLAMETVNQTYGPVTVDLVKRLDGEGKLKRNCIRPPLKDTVTVPEGGYTIIRFIADNPGVWFFHCHLDFHSEVGMGFLLKVGRTTDLPKRPLGWRKCGSYLHNNTLKPI